MNEESIDNTVSPIYKKTNRPSRTNVARSILMELFNLGFYTSAKHRKESFISPK